MSQALRTAAAILSDLAFHRRDPELREAAESVRTALAEDDFSEPVELSETRINEIADLVLKGMPDGIQGFCKTWGWQQFARALLEDCAGHYAVPSQAPALLLRGIGKINGDGWKDTTRIGDVVYAWNVEMPRPYAPGQYPRLGYPGWTASKDQFDFQPVPHEELRSIIDQRLASLTWSLAQFRRAEATQGGAK